MLKESTLADSREHTCSYFHNNVLISTSRTSEIRGRDNRVLKAALLVLIIHYWLKFKDFRLDSSFILLDQISKNFYTEHFLSKLCAHSRYDDKRYDL